MLQHQALHCRIVCLPNKTSGCARHIIRGQFRCNRFANESHCMLLFFPRRCFHFTSFHSAKVPGLYLFYSVQNFTFHQHHRLQSTGSVVVSSARASAFHLPFILNVVPNKQNTFVKFWSKCARSQNRHNIQLQARKSSSFDSVGVFPHSLDIIPFCSYW